MPTRIPLVFYSTVFLTGAAVLILEVAAVRFLTPVFGSSLYVLSSVLSVILLALSLGYFFGGRIADSRPDPLPLYGIITISGLSILLLQIAALFILGAGTEMHSVVYGPLIFATLFFFLPAFLLGMDSPYVIRLLTELTPKDQAGHYVGNTFFWSTLGSITGSLLAGFWCIPTLGVTNTITYTAFLLTTLGVTAPLVLPPLRQHNESLDRSKWYGLIALVGLVVFCLFMTIEVLDRPGKNVIYAYDGLYSNIRVEEYKIGTYTVHQLRRDRNRSSAVFLETNELVFDYSKFITLLPELAPDAKTFLQIGGGAYTIPRYLMQADDSIVVDVAEIEPSLFPLAQKYFDLSDTSRINNHVMDARLFLQSTSTQYDAVFSDAMGTELGIPFHLVTKEFYELLKQHMTPNAVLFVNYIGLPETAPDTLTSAVVTTLESVFPDVHMYLTRPDKQTEMQNIVFIATNGPEPLTIPDSLSIGKIHSEATTLGEMKFDISKYHTPNRRILTDDNAPVELLGAEQLARSYEYEAEF